MPRAYLIPADQESIIEKLSQHGIEVTRLERSITIEVEAFTVSQIETQDAVQNGHQNTRLSGDFQSMERTFQEGDYQVPLDNPLANLIFYLLEPQADDGLAYWNYFDQHLQNLQANDRPLIYPVFKLMEQAGAVSDQ